MRTYLNILFALVLIFVSCNTQKKYSSKLEGEWELSRVASYDILQDGTTENHIETLNGGTIIFESTDSDSYFTKALLNLNNNFQNLSFSVKTDEHNKRIFFYNYYCNLPLNCDLVGTIVTDKPKLQIWSFVERTSNTQIHTRTTWELKRN